MSLSKLGQFIIQYVVDNKYKILGKIVDLTTSKFNLSKEIINKINLIIKKYLFLFLLTYFKIYYYINFLNTRFFLTFFLPFCNF